MQHFVRMRYVIKWARRLFLAVKSDITTTVNDTSIPFQENQHAQYHNTETEAAEWKSAFINEPVTSLEFYMWVCLREWLLRTMNDLQNHAELAHWTGLPIAASSCHFFSFVIWVALWKGNKNSKKMSILRNTEHEWLKHGLCINCWLFISTFLFCLILLIYLLTNFMYTPHTEHTFWIFSSAIQLSQQQMSHVWRRVVKVGAYWNDQSQHVTERMWH